MMSRGSLVGGGHKLTPYALETAVPDLARDNKNKEEDDNWEELEVYEEV
jgi:hypothetical protein